MSNKIRDKLDSLTEQDSYSILMFALYEIQSIPSYKVLSSLIYLLKKEDFLKIIKYFGGTTITLPTLDDLKLLTQCLLLVKYVDIEEMSISNALAKLGLESSEKVMSAYKAIKTSLDKYHLSSGRDTQW